MPDHLQCVVDSCAKCSITHFMSSLSLLFLLEKRHFLVDDVSDLFDMLLRLAQILIDRFLVHFVDFRYGKRADDSNNEQRHATEPRTHVRERPEEESELQSVISPCYALQNNCTLIVSMMSSRRIERRIVSRTWLACSRKTSTCWCTFCGGNCVAWLLIISLQHSCASPISNTHSPIHNNAIFYFGASSLRILDIRTPIKLTGSHGLSPRPCPSSPCLVAQP